MLDKFIQALDIISVAVLWYQQVGSLPVHLVHNRPKTLRFDWGNIILPSLKAQNNGMCYILLCFDLFALASGLSQLKGWYIRVIIRIILTIILRFSKIFHLFFPENLCTWFFKTCISVNDWNLKDFLNQ